MYALLQGRCWDQYGNWLILESRLDQRSGIFLTRISDYRGCGTVLVGTLTRPLVGRLQVQVL